MVVLRALLLSTLVAAALGLATDWQLSADMAGVGNAGGSSGGFVDRFSSEMTVDGAGGYPLSALGKASQTSASNSTPQASMAVRVDKKLMTRGAELYVSTIPFERFSAPTEGGLQRWSAVAMEAADANGIPRQFFIRLISQESGFKPTSISKAGALGIAQFMPATAVAMGLRDPFEPVTAIHASAAYLAMLLKRFGNVGLAAAAYNAGAERVSGWLSGRRSLPEETRNYVRAVTGLDAESWRGPAALTPAPGPAHAVSHKTSRHSVSATSLARR